jgi:hypothetical protein
MSVYLGKLTKSGIANAIIMMEAAFPDLDEAYYKIFQLIIKESNMCDQKLADAVFAKGGKEILDQIKLTLKK